MPVLDVPPPAFMQDPEIQMFADSANRFFERAAPAERVLGWREAGQVERSFWRETGAAGFLGVTVPEAYGGPGADFRHELVLLDVDRAAKSRGFRARACTMSSSRPTSCCTGPRSRSAAGCPSWFPVNACAPSP